MRKLQFYIMLLLLFVFVTGCSKEEPEPIDGNSLVIIAGRHANANMYSEDELNAMSDHIRNSISLWKDEELDKYCAQAKISIIVSDGAPSALPIVINGNSNTQETLYCRTNTIERRDVLVEEMIEGILNFLKSDEVIADDPQVDLLAALSEAQTILANNPGKENHIYVYDTGINTAGAFDMRQINIKYGSTEQVIDRIAYGGLPRLDDIYVTLKGLGNVAGNQVDMRSDNQFKRRLEELWTQVIEASNGVLTEAVIYSAKGNEPMMWFEEDSVYPYVSYIGFELNKPLKDKDKLYEPIVGGGEQTEEVVVEPDPEYIPEKPEPVVVKFSSFGFKANSTSFIDEADAIRVLGDIADTFRNWLSYYPSKKIYIVGSIARVEQGEAVIPSHELSKGRAEKVAEILVSEFNINANQLVVVDAGTTIFSWRNNEEFVDGILNKENQQNNRLVAIIPEGDTLMAELADNGYLD